MRSDFFVIANVDNATDDVVLCSAFYFVFWSLNNFKVLKL